jgi:hypothetical protein
MVPSKHWTSAIFWDFAKIPVHIPAGELDLVIVETRYEKEPACLTSNLTVVPPASYSFS